jgi:ubiquinone/menaquinone biosynthesis C-methylase UbiE
MPQVEHIGMFTTVDELDDPGVFIGFLDRVEDVAEVRALRKDLVRRLELRPGESVLDVGCGTGDYTREVAALVAPGGRAVGLDFSRAMIGEALTRQAASRLPATFEQGDAQRLPFDSGTFDAARTERMLCHVPDHEAALREMVRAVRPGGRVGVIDVDLAGVMIDHPDRGVTDAFIASLAGTMQHPHIGRTLRRAMADSGLVDVDVRALVIDCPFGVVEMLIDGHAPLMVDAGLSREAVDRWRRELEYANLAGTFFMGMTLFAAVGRKP